MSLECKDCECDLDYCCCDDACPVCGHAPTHCNGLAAFATEFGFPPMSADLKEERRRPGVEQQCSAKGARP